MIATLDQRRLRRLGAFFFAFILPLATVACSGGGGSDGGSTSSITTPGAPASGDATGGTGGSAAASEGTAGGGTDTSGTGGTGTSGTGTSGTGGTGTSGTGGTDTSGTGTSGTDGTGTGTSGGGTSGGGSGTITPVAFPGGFMELATSTVTRAVPSAAAIQAFLPAGRGGFNFPAPYNTRGIRITIPSDCGGSDCVQSVGYAYWRNINNHVGSDTMYIFLGLNPSAGGGGPTLFSYNKTTEVVTKVGPLFAAGSSLGGKDTEQWYFSATMPTKMYVFDTGGGGSLLRYDVLTKTTQTVFNVNTYFGGGKYIWQPHSSNDDNVHMATVRNSSSYAMEGCIVFTESTQQFRYFPAIGGLDECNIDKSGRWLIRLEQLSGSSGLDNIINDLQTGTQTTLLDSNGGAGHLDTGYGVMVGEDNWNGLPGAARLYTFGQTPIAGPVVYHTTDWGNDMGHVSFQNASSTIPTAQQHACNSHVSRSNPARANEIVCFRMNNSLQTLIVAPVMTNLNSTGGGSDDYMKAPKGNIDITGQYFIWTSNMSSGRQDAFIVKVPSLLFGS